MHEITSQKAAIFIMQNAVADVKF